MLHESLHIKGNNINDEKMYTPTHYPVAVPWKYDNTGLYFCDFINSQLCFQTSFPNGTY